MSTNSGKEVIPPETYLGAVKILFAHPLLPVSVPPADQAELALKKFRDLLFSCAAVKSYPNKSLEQLKSEGVLRVDISQLDSEKITEIADAAVKVAEIIRKIDPDPKKQSELTKQLVTAELSVKSPSEDIEEKIQASDKESAMSSALQGLKEIQDLQKRYSEDAKKAAKPEEMAQQQTIRKHQAKILRNAASEKAAKAEAERREAQARTEATTTAAEASKKAVTREIATKEAAEQRMKKGLAKRQAAAEQRNAKNPENPSSKLGF